MCTVLFSKQTTGCQAFRLYQQMKPCSRQTIPGHETMQRTIPAHETMQQTIPAHETMHVYRMKKIQISEIFCLFLLPQNLLVTDHF